VPPKPPRSFEPLLEPWPANRPLYRVHPVRQPANELFTTDRLARFRPLRTADGEIVSMLYGAADERAAIAESILHDLAPSGPRVVAFESLVPLGLSCLIPQRDLRLAMLHSTGLDRLRLRNADLIDTLPTRYPDTLPWGQALYDHALHLDGIVWMSRRYNSMRACVLFGSTRSDERIASSHLVVDLERSFPTLAFGRGYELVADVCTAADVLITRP
jgi:RES domain